MIVLYKGEPRAGIPVKFNGNPLEINGYEISDITNVYIGFKKKAGEDSDDKYLAKYWKDENGDETGGISFDGINPIFSLKLLYADYDNIEIGEYEFIIGVKVSDIPSYIELNLKSGDEVVKIINDKIRE